MLKEKYQQLQSFNPDKHSGASLLGLQSVIVKATAVQTATLSLPQLNTLLPKQKYSRKNTQRITLSVNKTFDYL